MKKRPVTMVSCSQTGPFKKYQCKSCGDKIVIAASDAYCPKCCSEIPKADFEAEGLSLKADLTASVAEQGHRLVCQSCDAKLYSTNKMSSEALANSCYCPVCASGDLDVVEDDDDFGDDGVNPEVNEQMDSKCKTKAGEDCEGEDCPPDDNLEDGETDAKTEAGSDPITDDPSEGEPTPEDDVEEEVKDTLSPDEDEDFNDMEAALIASPEQAWVIFHKGNPRYRIGISKISAAVHPIFATEVFLKSFQDRVKETSIAQAVKEFNADILDAKMISSTDLEPLAYNTFQTTVLPKFLDCVALAIEASAKGIYPELNSELKAAFFDEIVARGITPSRAQEAIEAAFISAGTDVFTAIVSKAMELMNKDGKVLSEIKATVQRAGIVAGAPVVTGSDLEEQEVRSKLKAGSIPVTASQSEVTSTVSKATPLAKATVDQLRTRLNLGKQ